MSLYIFDKDLTLVDGVQGRPPSTIDEQVLLPNVAETCRELRENGDVLAVASNQGGVAFGIIDAETARALVRHAAEAIDAIDFEVCFHHPRGRIAPYNQECENRKPNPGMLQGLMQRLGFGPEETIFVGDADSDREAAEAAGVRFIDAKDFFRDEGSVN